MNLLGYLGGAYMILWLLLAGYLGLLFTRMHRLHVKLDELELESQGQANDD